MLGNLEKVSEDYLRKIKNGLVDLNQIDVIFKEVFSLNRKQDQLELVKQIAALANSQGGYIIYGISETHDWIGLDERSDDKIMNVELLDLITTYCSNEIVLVFNLVELDYGFYFVMYVEPIVAPEIIYMKSEGIFKIKNWGNRQDKELFVFNLGDVFCRKNHQTVMADETFYYEKNIHKLKTASLLDETIQSTKNVVLEKSDYIDYIDNIMEGIENHLPTNTVSNLDLIDASETKLNSSILPIEITIKIEELVATEKNLNALKNVFSKSESKEFLIQKTALINDQLTDHRADLKEKEIAVLYYKDEIRKIDEIEAEILLHEDEFYLLMELKKKQFLDKSYGIESVQITTNTRAQLNAMYQELSNQFEYGWQKKIDSFSHDLAILIKEKRRAIDLIRENIKSINNEEIKNLRRDILMLEEQFLSEREKINAIQNLEQQVSITNEKVLTLRSEINTESAEYLKKLISGEFNKHEKIQLNQSTQPKSVENITKSLLTDKKIIAFDQIYKN